MTALDEAWALRHGDAMDLLAGTRDGSVDLIVTDPPYESLEKHRAKGTTTRLKVSAGSSNEWFPVVPNAYLGPFLAECHRVLARHAHLYVYTDVETQFVVKPLAEAAGFRFWNSIVWDKGRMGMGYHYRRQHELILFLEKGKRRLHDLGIPDVLRVPKVTGGYPTEKPVELSEVFVRNSSDPGALVLDPFMGSGSVGVAAIRNGRRFVGGDVKENAVQLAARRLRGVREGLEETVDATQENESCPS